MDDLEEDMGALWHAAAALLDAGTLLQAVDDVGELSRSACWFPRQHVPAPLLPLLLSYVSERERPSGWLWEAMPPSLCLPDGLVERLSQRLTAALWRHAGERLHPDQFAALLEQWLPVGQGRAYESILGVVRQLRMTELDWHTTTR
jgi:hypothetical protein